MERDNREIRMKHCVSTKGINREQEITVFYGAGGMEVFYLTSIRHSVKLCTSSYIQEKMASVSLLHASSVLVKIAYSYQRTDYNQHVLLNAPVIVGAFC